MIDRLFALESTRARYKAAPLLRERESFLAHLYENGTSLERLRVIAATMIQIVRLMNLSTLRLITSFEVEDTARCWCADQYRARGRHKKSPENFTAVAMQWFRFADAMSPMARVQSEHESVLEHFCHYLNLDSGFSDQTIRCYFDRASQFLLWIRSKKTIFGDIGIDDVNAYLSHCLNLGFRPRTINGTCCALRSLFRYAASHGLGSSRIAARIKSVRIPRYQTRPRGPEWRDVRRLLDCGFGSTASELRAAAIVSLCAIYALRRCEVIRLKLTDIDWIAETITIRRGKSGKIQQFPLQYEVGEKILKYLRNARVKCTCRNMFVTIKPPYRKMDPSVTWHMIAKRMRYLGIPSESYGLHSLRHSCATKLLRDQFPLKGVAEFLGHADMSSVSIYAKFDLKTLGQVAAFSLAGLQ